MNLARKLSEEIKNSTENNKKILAMFKAGEPITGIASQLNLDALYVLNFLTFYKSLPDFLKKRLTK